jgi:hypothetical protein
MPPTETFIIGLIMRTGRIQPVEHSRAALVDRIQDMLFGRTRVVAIF